MEGARRGRRAAVEIVYEGTDISADLAPFLLSFEYSDKSSGECDDISVTLEDADGLWRDPWFPAKGDRVTASIVAEGWDEPEAKLSLYCGSFEIDDIEISEPPMTVRVRAVSAPRSVSARDERKSRNWEGYKLSGIAADIAASAEMTLEYLAEKDPMYDTRNQVKQPDLEFLMKLCSDAALALKVTDNKVVIFSEEEFEARDAVSEIARRDGRILSMSARSKSAGVYAAAEVSYNDTEADETFTGRAEDGGAEGNGQTLQINRRVKSPEEAEDLAKSLLREANKNEITGSFNLIGELSLVSGSNVTLAGYGKLDGKYFISAAKHSVGSGGYTTSIEIRKTPSPAKGKTYIRGYWRSKA